ncbi:MAG: hypothetical protein H7328_06905 [Bdellovibrio sp.]|nr:hypothetical protein [Bdellovibrio sp.]
MKLVLVAMIIASVNFAVAQDQSMTPLPRKVAQQSTNEVEPKVNPEQPEPPAGTIVKPTKEQLKTVPKAPVKKKATEETTTEIKTEETTTTVETTPAVETKKQEVTAVEEKPSTSKPHLFGLHADVNIPHLINYGLDYWHSSRWFSASANMGGASVPSSLVKSAISDIDDPSIKISNMEGVLRVHPFAGSFYIGAAYGNHKIEAAGNKTITITSPAPGSATFRLTDTIKANYFTPHIGWLWKLDMGLTFGFDLGYLNPSSVSVDLKEEALTPLPGGATLADFQSTAEYKKAKKDIVDGSEDVGKKGLPYLALFRIGYMF